MRMVRCKYKILMLVVFVTVAKIEYQRYLQYDLKPPVSKFSLLRNT